MLLWLGFLHFRKPQLTKEPPQYVHQQVPPHVPPLAQNVLIPLIGTLRRWANICPSLRRMSLTCSAAACLSCLVISRNWKTYSFIYSIIEISVLSSFLCSSISALTWFQDFFPATEVSVFFLSFFGNKEMVISFQIVLKRDWWQGRVYDGAGNSLDHSGTRKHGVGLLFLSKGKNKSFWPLGRN